MGVSDGDKEGRDVGGLEGSSVGMLDGPGDGEIVGAIEGMLVGWRVGSAVVVGVASVGLTQQLKARRKAIRTTMPPPLFLTPLFGDEDEDQSGLLEVCSNLRWLGLFNIFIRLAGLTLARHPGASSSFV